MFGDVECAVVVQVRVLSGRLRDERVIGGGDNGGDIRDGDVVGVEGGVGVHTMGVDEKGTLLAIQSGKRVIKGRFRKLEEVR